MAFAEHLIAHTRRGVRSLLEPAQASWLWARMRSNFPAALSFELMPDHTHLVHLPGARERYSKVLAAFTARFQVQFDVVTEVANSRAIAGRMIRYGFMNPVEARLVGDPWAWRWSTLRDLGGVAHPIWTRRETVARMLAIPMDKLLGVLTTSADHRPDPPQPVPVLTATTEALRMAVAAVLRIEARDVAERTDGRRLVVQAADAIEMPGGLRLASELGCSARTLYRDRGSRHPALDAVLLCLGDPRLRGDLSRNLPTSPSQAR
ncbi:MAG TPA: hypothetical protein VG755_17375 [Nannocystaceae bacterium]|nr:hypothetical protein [Nannocystaceae bacterium]